MEFMVLRASRVNKTGVHRKDKVVFRKHSMSQKEDIIDFTVIYKDIKKWSG